MPQSTKYVELDLPSDLVAQLTASTPTAARPGGPEPLEIIGRYILSSWIEDLKEDSPRHVGWISLFGKALLAYPGELLPESYRWPFEMLADMDPNLVRANPPTD